MTTWPRDNFARTAIFLTMDEGGGYYDSGYICPSISSATVRAFPSLVYLVLHEEGLGRSHLLRSRLDSQAHRTDWNLRPFSARSRDNLHNPIAGSNSYIPFNAPAIGDLMNFFDFDNFRSRAPRIIPA